MRSTFNITILKIESYHICRTVFEVQLFLPSISQILIESIEFQQIASIVGQCRFDQLQVESWRCTSHTSRRANVGG